jgi:hypothetical protein
MQIELKRLNLRLKLKGGNDSGVSGMILSYRNCFVRDGGTTYASASYAFGTVIGNIVSSVDVRVLCG